MGGQVVGDDAHATLREAGEECAVVVESVGMAVDEEDIGDGWNGGFKDADAGGSAASEVAYVELAGV